MKRGRDLSEIFNWPATKAVYALGCTKVKRKNRQFPLVLPYIYVTGSGLELLSINEIYAAIYDAARPAFAA
jgi:hypothetical protein